MEAYLFVYGTLRPGLAPREVAALMDTLEHVGEGSVAGVLYDLGEYPGATLNTHSEQRVYGTVFRLPEYASVLTALDTYEGFEQDCPEASLFVRELHVVELESGGSLPCWVYLYNREVASRAVIPSGKFTG